MDDKLFATLVVTSLMQLSGMLMLPEFYGSSYNLLLLPKRILTNLVMRETSQSGGTGSGTVEKKPIVVDEVKPQNSQPAGKKKKRRKRKTN